MVVTCPESSTYRKFRPQMSDITCYEKQWNSLKQQGNNENNYSPFNSPGPILPSLLMTNLQGMSDVAITPWQNSHNLISAFVRAAVLRGLPSGLRRGSIDMTQDSMSSPTLSVQTARR